MPLARTGYQLNYEEIAPGIPQFGAAATIPWDSAIFGFAAASYRAAANRFDDDHARAWQESFQSWMTSHAVHVCSCTLAPADSFWRMRLPRLGFDFVDVSLQVTLALASARLPSPRSELRLAKPNDHAAIEAIAAGSFSHGRYHADPRFPRDLANRRYSQWVRNALVSPSTADRVYVLEDSGRVAGFYHVTVEEQVSDLRLAAVAPEFQATMIGVEIYTAMLHELRRLGVRRAISSISAINTGIVNLYAMLGFRFSNPEIVYHWHAVKEGSE